MLTYGVLVFHIKLIKKLSFLSCKLMIEWLGDAFVFITSKQYLTSRKAENFVYRESSFNYTSIS